MVAFFPAVNEPAREALLNKFGALKIRNLPIIDGSVVLLPLPALGAIVREAGVRLVEVDQRVSAFPKPGGGTQPAQVVPTGIDRINAENLANTGAGVKVAVIDTGIDYTHPDLSAVYVSGIDYANDDNDPKDDNGHGTHVAGTVAAQNNSIGVVGVAPGVALYAVKVLDKNGSGWLSDVIAGIGWAKDNQMAVANMSLGAKGSSDALHTAVINATIAGVTLVVAAGNDSADAAAYIPAAYDEVITVSAIADFDGQPGGLASSKSYGRGRFAIVQKDDAFSYFSNYGAVVDIAAPGMDINSTWLGGTYKSISGTSMATPHVAGAAALYKASNPSATPAQVRTALRDNGWKSTDGLAGGYFTGDPDSYPEPLAKATGL
ncbi:MAG: S8 family peptidase [Chloroflexi bacterium]|nr:S8 family peptidase [Chloroflexota bacterium]